MLVSSFVVIFVVKSTHLLPLTRYVTKGQYVLVQPFGSNRAERCNYALLTTNECTEKPMTKVIGFSVFINTHPRSGYLYKANSCKAILNSLQIQAKRSFA